MVVDDAGAVVGGAGDVVTGELDVTEAADVLELVAAGFVVEHAPISAAANTAATNAMQRRTAAARRSLIPTRVRS